MDVNSQTFMFDYLEKQVASMSMSSTESSSSWGSSTVKSAEEIKTDVMMMQLQCQQEEEELYRMPPKKQECPICLIPMQEGQTQYQACCGKSLCGGCMHTMLKKAMKDAACPCGNPKCTAKGGNQARSLCPFCRTPVAGSDKQTLKRLRKRVALNDVNAVNLLGLFYAHALGVKKNVPLAMKYWEQAAEQGHVASNAYLGDAYNTRFDNGRGVPLAERDWKQSARYYEVAAKGGHIQARHNLAALHMNAGEPKIAKKHFLIAAKLGHDDALNVVKAGYKQGMFTKDEFAEALRAHKDSHDETSSGHRKNVFADDNNRWAVKGKTGLMSVLAAEEDYEGWG